MQGHADMETSQLIARFIGPVMLVAAVSALLNTKQVMAIFEDFIKSPALIFIAGVMTLVMGLTLVNFHNHWVADWTVIITIFGWIGIAGGIMRMAFPMFAIDMGKKMIGQTKMLVVIGIINILLGSFLTYKGYFV
jgi:hypothetical protein